MAVPLLSIVYLENAQIKASIKRWTSAQGWGRIGF
tara:strand:+ start:489 stop:593 length:105 start_codon:yes stop_codon:yes gene_type:complete